MWLIGALLGAEEFGFATAPLDRLRLHHDAQMPSEYLPGRHRHPGPGIAEAIPGKPEHVINFFFFVAEEVRRVWRHWASANFARWSAASICSNEDRRIDHWKAKGFDLSPILYRPAVPKGCRHCSIGSRTTASKSPRLQADRALRRRRWNEQEAVARAFRSATSTAPSARCLSGEIAKQYGHAGLPDDTIHVQIQRLRRAKFWRVSWP